jgi:hypothetical protein
MVNLNRVAERESVLGVIIYAQVRITVNSIAIWARTYISLLYKYSEDLEPTALRLQCCWTKQQSTQFFPSEWPPSN